MRVALDSKVTPAAPRNGTDPTDSLFHSRVFCPHMVHSPSCVCALLNLRRKSGPKAVDVEFVREDGKAARRRLSDAKRRTSKSSKAAALRRERGQLRPPLNGLRGIGRASLPARLPQETVAPAPAADAAAEAAAATPAGGDAGVVAMEQDKDEGEGGGGDGENEAGDDARQGGRGDGEGRWTPEMVAEAAKAILGDDRQLQIR